MSYGKLISFQLGLYCLINEGTYSADGILMVGGIIFSNLELQFTFCAVRPN